MADYASPAKNEKKAGGGSDAEKFMVQARKRFKSCMDASATSRKDAVDDVKFYAGSPDNGWQWDPQLRNKRMADPNGARPCLTINKLPQHLRQVTNEQRQNRPSIKVIPVDDKSDKELAKILNGITRHIEYISDADVAYDTAGECQVKSGEGFFRILTDYCTDTSMEQDIFIRRIRNPFSVYMDPDIQDPAGSDAKYCFITDELEEDEFKAMFPDARPIDWDQVAQGDELSVWFEGKKVRIAEYFCFKDEKKKLYQFSDGSVLVEGDPNLTALQTVERPIKERTTTIKKVMWSKMNGQEVLEEQDWAGKYIPVVRVVGNEEEVDGKIITSGIVRNAKDPQRMVNYWTSQEAEMLALAPKAPFVGYKGQFEGMEDQWGQANTVNWPYLEVNPVVDGTTGQVLPIPQRQQPPMPPVGIINAKMGSADDLKSTTGQYNPSLGQEGAAKSGIAIAREQKKGEVSNFQYLDNLARGIRHGGRIILDLIPKIYDTRRIVRIIGEDGEPDHVTVDPDAPQAVVEITDEQGAVQKIYNPTIGQYDVRVTTGPSYTTKRQEAAEFMAQVLQGNGELMAKMGDLYFEMLDVPGADKIAERLRKLLPPGVVDEKDGESKPVVQTPQGPVPVEQASQMIGQLMQQAEAMGQALEKAGVDKQEIEKLRLEIERYKAETARLEVVSKDTERQFDATVQYVDRTAVDDTALLAPGGTGAQPGAQQQ